MTPEGGRPCLSRARSGCRGSRPAISRLHKARILKQPRPPKMIHTFTLFPSAPPQPISEKCSSAKLLAVPIRLCGGSINLNSFTAPLHVQFAIKRACIVAKMYSYILLEVPIRLCGDSRDINSLTALPAPRFPAEEGVFSSLQHQDQIWSPLCPLPKEYWGFFPRGETPGG
jgi:hypothetical protein